MTAAGAVAPTVRATRAELVKLSSVPRLWVPPASAVIVAPLVALATFNRSGGDDTLTLVRMAGNGTQIVLPLLALWAAAVGASEFHSGAIASTLVGVGRRSRFYVGKLSAVAAVTFVVAIAAGGLAVGVLGAAGAGDHHVGDLWRLIAAGAVVSATSVAAAAVGIATRGPLFAMAVAAVGLFGPSLAGGLLGSLQRWVVGSSPNIVIGRLIANHDLGVAQLSPAGLAGALVGFAVGDLVVVSVGWLAFYRSDV